MSTTKLQWGRILVGGLLVEVALIIVLVPLLAFADIATLMPIILVGVFVIGFVISWWMAKRVNARRVLHGALMGVVATALYILLCMLQPDGGISAVIAMYGPILFVLGNLLRIVGCAAGGFAAIPRM
jgi:hypothetical protein